MAGRSAAGPEKQGSMVPFWIVMGLAVLMLVAYLASGGGRPSSGLASEKSRPLAPDFQVNRLGEQGKTVGLAGLKGRVVVLHFWATWCPPCRDEFPQFADFAISAKEQGDVAVLPVSVDQTAEPVGPYVDALGKRQFPVYLDTQGASTEFKITAIPTTIVLDKTGRVAFRKQGAVDWSKGGVPKLAEELARE